MIWSKGYNKVSINERDIQIGIPRARQPLSDGFMGEKQELKINSV